MEFPILIVFFAYIYYLRYIADKRTIADIEQERLAAEITLYHAGDIPAAFKACEKRILDNPKSSVAYLYRGLCHQQMNNAEAALHDFRTGITYDNLNAELYTALGKLQRDQGESDAAIVSFGTAIRVSRGMAPEPYHERAITLQLLNRGAEADIDFEAERFIREQQAAAERSALHPTPQPLLDRTLLLNSLLVLVTSALVILTIKKASSIHLPYLTAVFCSVAIGFAEPRRGWILAILQCLILFFGTTFLLEKPASQGRLELEYFSMFGAIALTFMTSFLGSFLKKAIVS